jgi:curved DNA-binding protein
MPKQDGGHGDLHAIVRITVPKHLSEQKRDLFAKLAEVSGFDPRQSRA